MPWKVEKRGNQYAVVKQGSGKVMGMHPSSTRAHAQMRALYANVQEPGSEKPRKDKSHKQNMLRSAAARRAGMMNKKSHSDMMEDKGEAGSKTADAREDKRESGRS